MNGMQNQYKVLLAIVNVFKTHNVVRAYHHTAFELSSQNAVSIY